MRNAVCNNVSQAQVTIARPSPAQPAQPSPPLCRYSPSIHSSSSVMLEPRIGWMGETEAGPTTIQGIDFDAEVPCADPSHEHPANVRIACKCPKCGTLAEAVCWLWWARLLAEGPLTHSTCGTGIPSGSLRIVEVLR